MILKIIVIVKLKNVILFTKSGVCLDFREKSWAAALARQEPRNERRSLERKGIQMPFSRQE